MAHLKTVAILILIPFLALTAYAVWDVGIIGIPEYHIHSSAGWQVFTDLVIALVLLMFFMVRDAKAKGVNPWPWVIATLFTGSISPLLYFAIYGGSQEAKA